MRTNYVLIDYENVQPDAMSVLNQEHFKVIVFVGANQAKVTFEVASALQGMGARARYIKISGAGSNALDFHIAFYIGQIAAAEPDVYFHIISKDTGFDPLIAHLKTRKIFACRSRAVTDIPLVKAAYSKTPAEKMAVVIAKLQQQGASRPRTVKTLAGTINALFQNTIPDDEMIALMKLLQDGGTVIVNGTKVAYSLPP